ncbi:MAG TPA: trypsin-like peptidase domain-containing protein [Anaerolineae bacterium]|nr:trypsin-like peptidase domain-containing protein [Anaerolineae bacterium]
MRSRRYIILVAAVLALVLAATGCTSLGVLTLTPASAVKDALQTTTEVRSETAAIMAVDDAVNALQSQIIEVYQVTAPAVVNITNRGSVYDRFMGAVPQEGTGSGFVYDTEGHIVTNYHVVENAQQLLVTLADGQTYEAQIVGTDPINDLAVISVDGAKSLPEPLVVGDSDSLQVGQFVLAIGNPFGLEQTLTTGVVSALGRVIQSPEDNRFIGEAIQTDAAINPGNSGGPLLDLSGQVIGVNSQIISPSGASSGIGFAVSASTVRRVVPQLISNGKYSHPWLGVQLLSLTSANVNALKEAGVGVPVDSGVLVLEAVAGGPADKAGIRGGSRVVRIGNYQVPVEGDIIVAIDGQALASSQDLTVYLETETTVGDTVELSIVRNGEEQVARVVLGEQP